MSNIILKICLGTISILIIKEYIGITLRKRVKNKEIFWGIALVASVFLEINSGIPSLNFLLNYIFFFLICIIGYIGELKRKIVVSFSLIVIWAIGEIITGCLTMATHIYFVSPEIQGSIVSKLIVLLLVEIAKRIYSEYRYKGDGFQNLKYWWILVLLPLCSIIIVYFIFWLVIEQKDSSMVGGALAVSCLFLPMNLGIFKMYNILIYKFELEQQNISYRDNIRMFSREMKIKETSMVVQSFLHDIKKHLLTLQGIAQQYQYNEILDYLEQMKINYVGEQSLIRSGNFVIDTLVNAKYKIIKEQNIDFRSRIIVPGEMEIEEADLCIVLGNALDNAIEALENVENKKLEVSIIYKMGKITIGIKSTYSGNIYKNQENDLVSTKSSSTNYGIGIKLIKKVVEKYNGFLDIKYDDHFFTFIAQLNERNK